MALGVPKVCQQPSIMAAKQAETPPLGAGSAFASERPMNRRSLLVAWIANLLLACGGEASQSVGGVPSASAGHVGTAGDTSVAGANGGGAGGGSGGATAHCGAFPGCPQGERRATDAECPGQASCHELTACDSTIWCVDNDGTSGAGGSSSGATHACTGQTCGATQACIAFRTVGGPIVVPDPDAGACPDGQHMEGLTCAADFSYECVELHGACANQPLACACAQPSAVAVGVCPVGYGYCSEPGSDVAAQLICELHSNAL